MRRGSHQDLPVRISNSQPCQGQRRISPRRDIAYRPGSLEATAPVSLPCDRLAPLCGHRSESANSSPPTLKTTMSRLPARTSLRAPGGSSAALATTCRAMVRAAPASGQPVDGARVAHEDLLLSLARQAGGERAGGIIEVPM